MSLKRTAVSILYRRGVIRRKTAIVTLIVWPWNAALLIINAYGHACLVTNVDLKMLEGYFYTCIYKILKWRQCACIWPRYYLLCNCHTSLRYAPKYDVTHRLTNAAFSTPSFTKLANTQQNNMQISYTEFHQTRTINVECTVINSLSPLSKVWFSPSWFSRN